MTTACFHLIFCSVEVPLTNLGVYGDILVTGGVDGSSPIFFLNTVESSLMLELPADRLSLHTEIGCWEGFSAAEFELLESEVSFYY